MTVGGRYVVHDELASGGMASVHLGRLIGPVGFSRTVAIKILHPQYAKDPEFVAMFVDEARLAARIRHPNVVATVDVVSTGKDLLLVMEYVPGETLARLLRLTRLDGTPVPPAIVSAIVVDLLDGLHAAHEARDEQDEPLEIVHRDVSPQNVMVGHDGTARVLDFGIAKASSRSQSTGDGQVKGKFAYMAPEQITRQTVDRRTDVFAASIVLWEALTGYRLFAADDPAAIVARVMNDPIPPPSQVIAGLAPAVDVVVMKALCRDKAGRYATAGAFARALEDALPPARRSEVRAWVEKTAARILAERSQRVAEIERGSAPSQTFTSVGDVLTTPGGPSAIPVTLMEGRAAEDPLRMRGDGSRARAGWFPYVASVGFSMGLVLFLALRHSGAGATATALPALTMTSPTPSSAPLSSGPRAPTAPPTPPITSAASSGSAESLASSIAPVSSPPRLNIAPRSPPRRPLVQAPNPCDPPYTFNDAGAKRWKPSCL